MTDIKEDSLQTILCLTKVFWNIGYDNNNPNNDTNTNTNTVV